MISLFYHSVSSTKDDKSLLEYAKPVSFWNNGYKSYLSIFG